MNNSNFYSLISVIIPFHKRFSILSLTISELKRQSCDLSTALQVVVVDSNSDPRSLDRLSTQYKSASFYVDVLHVVNNVSVKRNRGASFAKGSVLIFLDDDCVPQSNFIHFHLSTLRPGFIASGQVAFDFVRSYSNFIRFRDFSENRINTHSDKCSVAAHHARSMNFSIYKSSWIDSSLSFDELFRGYGWEDPVFFSQCIKKGLKIYSTEALVIHDDRTGLSNYRLKMRQLGQWYSRVLTNYPDLVESLPLHYFARLLPFIFVFSPFLILFGEFMFFLLLLTDKRPIFFSPYPFRLLSFIDFLIGYIQSSMFGVRYSYRDQPLS